MAYCTPIDRIQNIQFKEESGTVLRPMFNQLCGFVEKDKNTNIRRF